MYTGFILNYLFAWLAVLIGILLLSKYILRRLTSKTKNLEPHHLLKRLAGSNKYWRYLHIFLGFALIIVGFVHGMHSSVSVWSCNMGTLVWLLTILFAFTWIFKKKLRAKWLRLHQILTLLFIAAVAWHVVDAGGIHVFRILSEMNETATYEASVDHISADPKTGIQNPETDQDHAAKNSHDEPDTSAQQEKLPYYFSFEGLELADGAYIAEDTGYNPGLKVEVIIEKNMVQKIKILAHHEIDSHYYKEAMNIIPAAILSQQTLDVDAISGSSKTSVGIIRAVRKAVLAAREKAETQTKQENE